MAKSLEQIKKEFHNLYSGIKKLEVDIYTTRDRKNKERLFLEHVETQNKIHNKEVTDKQ